MRGYLFLLFLALGSLFAVLGLKQLFLDPLPGGPFSGGNLIWLGAQVLPLLALLPPLLGDAAGRRLGGMLAALAGMAYFCYGVWLAVDNSALGLALVASALVTVAVGALLARAAGASG
ncbi:MAG: hypothetical protein AAGG11_24750 [Pseudomonadota bacterium]